MPTHAEKRTLPYTAEQLFHLVQDVDRYPQFLPWCIGARVKSRIENVIIADLVIGYKMFREKFESRVTLSPNNHIRVEYLNGPLQHLNNTWTFIPDGEGACTIDFFIDFEFRSKMLQKVMGVFFNEAVRRMVQAFEDRANDLYGSTACLATPTKAY